MRGLKELFGKLKSLRLLNTNVKAFEMLGPMMKSISVAILRFGDGWELIVENVKPLSSVRHLKIEYLTIVQDKAIRFLCQKFPELESLQLLDKCVSFSFYKRQSKDSFFPIAGIR